MVICHSSIPPIFFYTTWVYILNSSCVNDKVEHLVTTQPGDGPVAANAGGKRWQLEDKWPHVGVSISVWCSDVDPGVRACTFTHLGLPGNQHWSVVIHIDQVDLEGSCPTGLRGTWRRVRRKTERGDGGIMLTMEREEWWLGRGVGMK